MTDKPNILVFVSDSLRRDHVGVYSKQRIITPSLNTFAQQSVVFDHAYVGSFPTVPARADLLTGRKSCTFMGWEPLPRELPVLPEILREQGYVCFGAVDTPFYMRDGFGYDRGFNDFVSVRGQGNEKRIMERTDVRSDWRCEEDRMAAQTVKVAERWLERHYKERFFMLVDTWDPHEPYDAPDYFTELYLDKYDGSQVYPPYADWKEAGLTEEQLRIGHATYCGEVTMVDRWFGILMSKLEVLGIADKTVVFFTADHGCLFGEHGLFGKATMVWDQWDEGKGASDSPPDDGEPSWVRTSFMKAIGRSPLYQDIARIPFLVRGPGFAPRRTAAMAEWIDFSATALDLAGAGSQAGMHGRSLLGCLRDGRDDHRPFVISSWPMYFAPGETTAAVDHRSRTLRGYQPITVSSREAAVLVGGPNDPLEYFDLVRDPVGEFDIAASEPARAAALAWEAMDELARQGTLDKHVEPRRESIRRWRARHGVR